jgi:hypothetical protein
MHASLLVLMLSLPSLAPATEAIRRCQAGDGTMVYTDQPCATLDARPIAPPEPMESSKAKAETAAASRAAATRFMNRAGAMSLGGISRDDCIRRTDTLLFELRAAIESRNVNRLAGIYDWAGKDADAAGAILERLASLAERPQAAVEFRYRDPAVYSGPAAIPAVATRPERPIGVRIAQQAPGEHVPSFEADLRLVRNADCWWVSF